MIESLVHTQINIVLNALLNTIKNKSTIILINLSVSKINQTSQLHATTIIDGINGYANIANYRCDHFHGILNYNVCEQALKNCMLVYLTIFSMMTV